MRVCIVYDCLFPYTIGGGERWYRDLAERLAREGHDVTYLTLRQWERHERAQVAGVRVVSVGPRMALYTPDGRRRILPPLVFGAGVLAHLLRHGRRYQVLDTSAFPYFSLLAAALARPLGGFELVVDWFEVWSDSYWREYLGPVGGAIGAFVQRLCARVPQRAFCISELHAERLREEGLKGQVTVLRGLYAGAGAARDGELPAVPAARVTDTADARPDEPLVLFAGRLIPEKHVTLAVAAIALAAKRIDGLHGMICGDGPERALLDAAIAEHGVGEIVSAPGFVDGERLAADMDRAMCMLLTSRREGYGLVVVEAAAHGTPSVVVAGEDNAATELIVEGVNGTVAPSADPPAVAEAIERVHQGGRALRESTARWFAENAERLSLESSLQTVLASYARQPSS
ncbi:MAG TPA: glycosyltransferase [Solirubrobacteraceae bacterium]|jgi:glycosyltransferase involved in cell wall biosynthesis|nr:glycosyltransferase [Solirubrobacteraceae bacterium]